MEPLTEKESDVNTSSKKMKIILAILIAVIIALIIVLIIVIVTKKTETITIEKIVEKETETIDWRFYGTIIPNISYANSNNMIVNSFKENGENYNSTIGNINEGNDYEKNERNTYSLYIPYSATQRKTENNHIILFIHGGSWIGGEKESLEPFCKIYAQMGYITATLGYTLLNGDYKNYNIFRQLDEITACIQSIIAQLKEQKFDEKKLEIAIAGYSAGAHLTLLYSYLMQNFPIPVKFAVNICGPVSLEPKYFYKNVIFNNTLDSLGIQDIIKALDNKSIVRINEDDSSLLYFMNIFIGKKYSDADLKEMLYENKKINYDSEKYKEMIKVVQHGFPVNFINELSVPTICLYGGNDEVVGVTQYAYLEERYGGNLHLIYSKYATHNFVDFETEVGINSLRELNYQIVNFAKKYFSS